MKIVLLKGGLLEMLNEGWWSRWRMGRCRICDEVIAGILTDRWMFREIEGLVVDVSERALGLVDANTLRIE